MSNAAPRMPADDAVDILRRLEPAIAKLDSRLDRLEAEQRRQADTMTKIAVEVGELRGKVSQLPTLVQIIAAVLAVNAGIVALSFSIANLLARH